MENYQKHLFEKLSKNHAAFNSSNPVRYAPTQFTVSAPLSNETLGAESDSDDESDAASEAGLLF